MVQIACVIVMSAAELFQVINAELKNANPLV
jgi:hypothetical protein